MKTILIFHSNQQSIAELQATLAGRCFFYATTRRQTAIEFIQQNSVDCVLFYLPGELDYTMKRESVRLLKHFQKNQKEKIAKIVICSNHDEWQVKDWLKLGVTAILGDVGALEVVWGE